MRRAVQIIVPFVLILAFIGLGYELFFNPVGFFKQLLFIAGFVAVIYLLYRWYLSRRYGIRLFPSRQGPTKAQLRRAKRTSTVQSTFRRQSTSKGPNRKKNQPRKSSSRSPLKRREDHNLTVIEGKKSKKKNRAFF